MNYKNSTLVILGVAKSDICISFQCGFLLRITYFYLSLPFIVEYV